MIQRSKIGLKFFPPAFSTPCLCSGSANRSDAWHITVALPAQKDCAQTVSANVLNWTPRFTLKSLLACNSTPASNINVRMLSWVQVEGGHLCVACWLLAIVGKSGGREQTIMMLINMKHLIYHFNDVFLADLLLLNLFFCKKQALVLHNSEFQKLKIKSFV